MRQELAYFLLPHEDELITQNERFEILDKIRRCLTARKFQYTVRNYGRLK